MADTQLTWLGHASFRFDSPGGKRVYVDPFLNGNPKTPDNEKEPERVDIIAITHGHGDHVGDTVDIWKQHNPVVVAPVELTIWLVSKQGSTRRAPATRTRAAPSTSRASSSRSPMQTTRARSGSGRISSTPASLSAT